MTLSLRDILPPHLVRYDAYDLADLTLETLFRLGARALKDGDRGMSDAVISELGRRKARGEVAP